MSLKWLGIHSSVAQLISHTIYRPGSLGLNEIDDIELSEGDGRSRFGSIVKNGVIEDGKLVARPDFVNDTDVNPSGRMFAAIYRYPGYGGWSGAESAVISFPVGIGAATPGYFSNGNHTLVTGAVTITTSAIGSITTHSTGKYFWANTGSLAAFPLPVSSMRYNSSGAIEAIAKFGPQSFPTAVFAGYGRQWCIGQDFSGSNGCLIGWGALNESGVDEYRMGNGLADAGEIDVRDVFPVQDVVKYLEFAWSNLYIFGGNSILVYWMGDDLNPATMSLTQVIDETGLKARASVVKTPDGILFLGKDGVYKIDKQGALAQFITARQISTLCGETVAELMGEATVLRGSGTGKNLGLEGTLNRVQGVYYPPQGWYILSFGQSKKALCFHTRENVPGLEVPAVTLWTTGVTWNHMTYDPVLDRLNAGGDNTVYKLSGYTPDGTSNAYSLTYYSQWMPLGDESVIKAFKELRFVLDAPVGTTGTIYWGYDYNDDALQSYNFTVDSSEFSENPGLGYVRHVIGGAGQVIKVGIEIPITGSKVTLNDITLLYTEGRRKK